MMNRHERLIQVRRTSTDRLLLLALLSVEQAEGKLEMKFPAREIKLELNVAHQLLDELRRRGDQAQLF